MSFTNPTRANWQPGHIPQLKYRNPAPAEDQDEDGSRDQAPLQEITNINDDCHPLSPSEAAAKSNGPTIRQIRQSMVHSRPPPSPVPKTAPPPKKKSLFGSLFTVKEPTQMALNQVTAQIIAQHGSTSATRVPNVRMERMPEYVPKVNSKWDGIPDQVKTREKQEKDRLRATKRLSVGGDASNRSRSVDSQERRGRRRMSYTSSSNGSRPKSTMSTTSNPRNPNPHRFYAASCNSSGDLAAQQRDQAIEEDKNQNYRPKSGVSQSFRSPSGTSLPEITAYFPDDVPANPPIPEKYRAEPSPVPIYRPLTQTSFDPNVQAPSLETLPEHTSSPVATPREGSPVTPLTQQVQHTSVNESSTTTTSKLESMSISNAPTDTLALPTAKPTKPSRNPADAFLAGEARELQLPDDDEGPSSDLPLRNWGDIHARLSEKSNTHKPVDRLIPDIEKRPDSSRARLGLRASMLVRTEGAPWEAQDYPTTPPLSPVSVSTRNSMGPLTPRTFLSKSFVGSLRSTRS